MHMKVGESLVKLWEEFKEKHNPGIKPGGMFFSYI